LRTLFLIGAGCSRNYPEADHGIVGLESPLNRDFFDKAKLVIDHDRLDATRLRSLFRDLHQLYGLHLRNPDLGASSLDNLEAVMTHLNMKRQLFDSRRYHPEPTSEEVLKELIAYVIIRAQSGPVSTTHRALARKFAPGDTIVDFNYDLLLENAMAAEGRFDEAGYCLPFYQVVTPDGVRAMEHDQAKMQVLKLHGSLNWGRCIECTSLILITNPLRLLRLFPSREPSLECPRCNRKGSLELMIVPPLQTKEYADNPFRFLWLYSERKTIGTDRIVSIGYSFSDNDRAAEALLRTSVGSQTRISLDVVTTPDSRTQLERRYHKVFPNAEISWFDSLVDYVR
jgi:hypothetical protein